MAFGDLLGSLVIGKTSVTNPMAAVGSVTVTIGDLIVAFGAELLNLTLSAVSDNLGNSYTAQNAGTDGGNMTGRLYYSIATVGGTLTTVNGTFTASTDDAAFVAAVFSKGPNGFAVNPVDANPANLSADTTSPYTTPATGVLAQASELVIGAFSQGTVVSTITAQAPTLLAVTQGSAVVGTSSAAVASIGYQVVSATTSITLNFLASGSVSADTLHTISFKQAAAVSSTPQGWNDLENFARRRYFQSLQPDEPTDQWPVTVVLTPTQFGWYIDPQFPIRRKLSPQNQADEFVRFPPAIISTAQYGWNVEPQFAERKVYQQVSKQDDFIGGTLPSITPTQQGFDWPAQFPVRRIIRLYQNTDEELFRLFSVTTPTQLGWENPEQYAQRLRILFKMWDSSSEGQAPHAPMPAALTHFLMLLGFGR